MEFGPREIFAFNVFGFNVIIDETITVTWGIMLLLVLSSLLLVRGFTKIPGKVQNFIEIVVEQVYNLTASTMGREKSGFAPYIGSIALYIALANLCGLVGLRPPTADLNTTFALSLITFFNIHYYGIMSQGITRYIKGYFQPVFFLAPLNVISELSTPLSLSFRLFGNMLGAFIIIELVYGILPVAAPVLPHLYFDLFGGILQTFIFIMLTMTFITITMD